MIIPMTYKVLVKPDDLDRDPVYNSAQKAGIIFAENEDRERAKMAMDTGVVVSIGPTAFAAYAKEAGFTSQEEQGWLMVGDRVGYAKYAGKTQVDPETQERFVILADEDINCIIKG